MYSDCTNVLHIENKRLVLRDVAVAVTKPMCCRENKELRGRQAKQSVDSAKSVAADKTIKNKAELDRWVVNERDAWVMKKGTDRDRWVMTVSHTGEWWRTCVCVWMCVVHHVLIKCWHVCVEANTRAERKQHEEVHRRTQTTCNAPVETNGIYWKTTPRAAEQAQEGHWEGNKFITDTIPVQFYFKTVTTHQCMIIKHHCV